MHDAKCNFTIFLKIKKPDKDKIVILHIGDSHIQSDIWSFAQQELCCQNFWRCAENGVSYKCIDHQH